MKNLELKAFSNFDSSESINEYYVETLYQKDTYFQTDTGRLKLRQEKNKPSYVIYYNRPDTENEKISDYLFYPIEDADLFFKVFGNSLKEEIVVEKTRKLYLYKDARIHFDDVKDLGKFLEIEVIIKSDEQYAQQIMNELMVMLKIDKKDFISCGYRELLFKKNNETKNLEYYTNQNKIYWVVNKDINEHIKANDIVPCIYVEKMNEERYILQFDESIKWDNFKYTAWRNFIGSKYSTYVDVLLIKNNTLYTLNNQIVEFENLKRSSKIIDKEYLAKFGFKN